MSMNIEALCAAPPKALAHRKQPEPNAAELPSCAPISARAAQRRRRRRWWRGGEWPCPGTRGEKLPCYRVTTALANQRRVFNRPDCPYFGIVYWLYVKGKYRKTVWFLQNTGTTPSNLGLGGPPPRPRPWPWPQDAASSSDGQVTAVQSLLEAGGTVWLVAERCISSRSGSHRRT